MNNIDMLQDFMSYLLSQRLEILFAVLVGVALAYAYAERS